METFSALPALCGGNPPVGSWVDSTQKDQWRRALMFSLICTWTNGLASDRDAGDLRHHRADYDVTVMMWYHFTKHNGVFLPIQDNSYNIAQSVQRLATTWNLIKLELFISFPYLGSVCIWSIWLCVHNHKRKHTGIFIAFANFCGRAIAFDGQCGTDC